MRIASCYSSFYEASVQIRPTTLHWNLPSATIAALILWWPIAKTSCCTYSTSSPSGLDFYIGNKVSRNRIAQNRAQCILCVERGWVPETLRLRNNERETFAGKLQTSWVQVRCARVSGGVIQLLHNTFFWKFDTPSPPSPSNANNVGPYCGAPS